MSPPSENSLKRLEKTTLPDPTKLRFSWKVKRLKAIVFRSLIRRLQKDAPLSLYVVLKWKLKRHLQAISTTWIQPNFNHEFMVIYYMHSIIISSYYIHKYSQNKEISKKVPVKHLLTHVGYIHQGHFIKCTIKTLKNFLWAPLE